MKSGESYFVKRLGYNWGKVEKTALSNFYTGFYPDILQEITLSIFKEKIHIL